MVVYRLSAVQAGMWKHRRSVMGQSGCVSAPERPPPGMRLIGRTVFQAAFSLTRGT